ncbi:putative quinol monooxygenase [Paraglaciecola arctica]|uniref:putative quinol monooxygenase n=1 Tax=Paraglaciecola arctica TaxID=1128911 RepID=UPI001C064BC7|nr:putative quinol monooxygenase [Paraglaciecola arctica]MBU3004929.1 antibiotic biosynthesis monooxygenase [Paraglaciecola arctica]
MIIITGDLLIKKGNMPLALQYAQKHVAQSRTEAGCISHGVYQDPENPLRLFFYEQWADQAAIDAHFALPSSQNFVALVSDLVTEVPNLHIFNAEQIK